MSRKLKFSLVALLALLGMIAGMQPAMADIPPGTMPGTVNVTVTQSNVLNTSSKVVAVKQASLGSKLQLEFESSVPWKRPAGMGCPFVKSSHAIPNHKTTKCFVLAEGQHFTNTGRNRDGSLVPIADICGSSLTPADTFYYKNGKLVSKGTAGAHAVKGCQFYWGSDGHWHKATCKNVSFFFGVAHAVSFKVVVMFHSFASIKWIQKLLIKRTLALNYNASCSFPGGGSSVTLTTRFTASVYVYVAVYAKYSFQAKASAGKLSVSQSDTVNVKVRESFVMTETTKVQQTCYYTPQQPSQTPPVTSNVETPQEFYADGETAPECATVNDISGDTIKVAFAVVDASNVNQSGWGAFSPSIVTITGTGIDKVCSTYTAPNTPDAVGKSIKFAVSAVDTTTNAQGNTAYSGAIPILAFPG